MRPPKNNFADYAASNNLRNLIEEYSKDNPLPPNEIGYNSSLKVKWVCEYGHIVYESPYNRIRRGYCPICGKLRKGSFAQNYPELAKMWSKNNKSTAEETPPTYTGIVLWQCRHGHEWARRISLQIKLQTCPYCEQEEKNFFEYHPEMLEQWDEELNGNIDTKTVMPYSNKKYHWICENGHRYQAAPEYLMRKKSRCPTCNSAGFNQSDIVDEWHPTKNGNKLPFDYSKKSQHNAWFICSKCGQEYMSRIDARVSRKTDKCPNCR